MPDGSRADRARDWVHDGAWPTASLRPGAPPWAAHALAMARILTDVIATSGLSVDAFAVRCDVSTKAVRALLDGQAAVSMYVIGQIEATSNTSIWPDVEQIAAAQPHR